MNIIEQTLYIFNPIDFVRNLIHDWSPSGCSTEKEYEDSLYSFLHMRLDKIQIVRQYGRGRAHVDLMVDEKVMIELKHALTSTSEYQRLIGQLVDYKEWGKDIIIVLTGTTEQSLLKQLRATIDRDFTGYTPLDVNVIVIIKG